MARTDAALMAAIIKGCKEAGQRVNKQIKAKQTPDSAAPQSEGSGKKGTDTLRLCSFKVLPRYSYYNAITSSG